MFEDKKNSSWFINILLVGSLISIILSFYFYYLNRDYDFIVETECNPKLETCFYRDCSIPDNCPPNNLFYYNQYTINANDYHKCINEDCTFACNSGLINCIKTECSQEDINIEFCKLPNSLITE